MSCVKIIRMLLLEMNQLWGVKSTSFLNQGASHHPIVDYFISIFLS